jgi:hypothetical protein
MAAGFTQAHLTRLKKMKANPEQLTEFDLVITVDCGLEFGVYYPTNSRKDTGPSCPSGRRLRWANETERATDAHNRI